MKILQITGFYPPSQGGIQFFVQELSRALARRGNDVDVLTINTEGGDPFETDSAGINIRRCQLSASYYRGLVSVDFAKRMMEAKPYDVYHLHIPFPLGLEIALVASKKNQKPLVATHHGQWTRGAPLYTLIASSYNLFSRAISLRGVDCPIFLTQSYTDSLWLPRAARRRVQIVPTGADIHSFSPDRDGSQIRRRYQLDDGAALALFVGSLNASNRYKGVDYLIRALPEIQKTVRDVRLIIVGGGPLLKELQDLTRQMGLDDTVVFTGPIENSLLPDYYAAADVFVLPSIRGPENSPVVVFEAMSSARPVVASRLPGVREIVRHEETGLLVPPGDTEALAAALVRVFTDRDFRASAGRQARARAEGYSWDHCAAKMETIFQELVSR